MKHIYLFILEIVPLEVGTVYEELPSHLTLMSRFLSHLPPDELSVIVQPLFTAAHPVRLVFGETIKLGPKKVTAHMVNSTEEHRLHDGLHEILDTVQVEYQYPEFIGGGHKPHVTAREGVQFSPTSKHVTSTAYLIEVIDKKRVFRAKFNLSAA